MLAVFIFHIAAGWLTAGCVMTVFLLWSRVWDFGDSFVVIRYGSIIKTSMSQECCNNRGALLRLFLVGSVSALFNDSEF